jgi:hypothetical protein
MKIVLQIAIGMVWLINGLYCKWLGAVPRHQQIVATILGDTHASLLTRLIGIGEVGIACWMFTGKSLHICVGCQILLVVAMNTIEFIFAPHLLLFGAYNAVFALAFVLFLWAVAYPIFYKHTIVNHV